MTVRFKSQLDNDSCMAGQHWRRNPFIIPCISEWQSSTVLNVGHCLRPLGTGKQGTFTIQGAGGVGVWMGEDQKRRL